jgi:hypothetical protein
MLTSLPQITTYSDMHQIRTTSFEICPLLLSPYKGLAFLVAQGLENQVWR